MDRGKYARFGTIIGAGLIALTLIGCSLGSSGSGGNSGIAAGGPASPSPIAIDSPSSAPSESAAPTDTQSAAPKPKPKPLAKPLTCPKTPATTGKPQSAKTVLGELIHASKLNAYKAANMDPVGLDPRLHGKLPNVHIPLRVLKAVAAEESAWTSNCVSTDGKGYGTFQMDVDAVTDANNHFHTSYDRMNPNQNVLLANEWLTYLTVRFGIEFFHNNFDLMSSFKLRDAVFAAYNTGLAVVDPAAGTQPIHIGPQGAAYASTVEGLMALSQPAQKSWGR